MCFSERLHIGKLKLEIVITKLKPTKIVILDDRTFSWIACAINTSSQPSFVTTSQKFLTKKKQKSRYWHLTNLYLITLAVRYSIKASK